MFGFCLFFDVLFVCLFVSVYKSKQTKTTSSGEKPKQHLLFSNLGTQASLQFAIVKWQELYIFMGRILLGCVRLFFFLCLCLVAVILILREFES